MKSGLDAMPLFLLDDLLSDIILSFCSVAGKPHSMNATASLTVCYSKTKDIKMYVNQNFKRFRDSNREIDSK